MGDIEQLTIGPGCEVSMYFKLSLPDGTIADAIQDGDPLVFTMGDGTLIDGLELMLYGLKAGDKECLSIDPRDAFGFPDDDNVHTMPRSEFSDDIPVEPGTVVAFTTPNGQEVPGTIKEVTNDSVIVDFNHPLAGFEVTFDVEILAVKPAGKGKK
ncbi:MAG: FKBP-type peptidyl-prolyl cis-trans isomerase [Gammaproteobacteria bacterium]|nr:FKBP-type peptidyl-prolyl cis-trans isomerase [Gammaproteobacteria bacterium]MDH5651162.1 FKBP-type peptidyl-prolyl cis-trans isomerase [Gammaproteobacteria bacterium]